MTSNTPDHEVPQDHETSPHDAPDLPAEPVQPASPAEVYDDDHARDVDADSQPSGVDGGAADVASEEREPYPIGATDAEPAPVTTTAAGDDIVIDYGSAQEPEPVEGAPSSDETEPALTKPSPADDQHPYPPQALGESTDVAAGTSTGAAAVAGAAAVDGTASDRDVAPSRPVYVQAPTPPKTKGNRGFGILIGLLATLVFGALYLLALVFVVTPFSGINDEAAPVATLTETLTSAVFFIPVIVFFLAWVLLVVILTRAPWWGYVIGGLFVGLLTYAGFLGGILAVNAFTVAPSQVPQFLLDHLFDAPALLAFVIAREVPIWFGVWVGKRGRAVRIRNAEAREEYERLLEAGPAARV